MVVLSLVMIAELFWRNSLSRVVVYMSFLMSGDIWTSSLCTLGETVVDPWTGRLNVLRLVAAVVLSRCVWMVSN